MRKIIYVLIGAFALIGLWVYASTPRGYVPRSNIRSTDPVRVSYRVSGTAPGASLTYRTESGNTEQKDVYSLPWQKWLDVRSGAILYVAAQNTGNYGTVKCEILVGDVVVNQATSEGAYKIATCSGRL